MQSPQSSNTFGNATVWILLAVIVLLAIVPLFLHPESEFGGADGSAEEVITAIDPDVEPWFDPLWEPPGGETESLLFALQAAIMPMPAVFAGLIQHRKRDWRCS